MTEAQKQAALNVNLNRAISLGGNIYFLIKLGTTHGKSFQKMADSIRGADVVVALAKSSGKVWPHPPL